MQKKAVTCSHTIRDHSTLTINPMVMCRRTWSTYGIPTFTYGIEATGFSEGYINDLEKIQVGLLKIGTSYAYVLCLKLPYTLFLG